MAFIDLRAAGFGGAKKKAKKAKKKVATKKAKPKKKAASRPARAKKKAVRKKAAKKATRRRLPVAEPSKDTCVRSPCGESYDPKLTMAQKGAARALVAKKPGFKKPRQAVVKRVKGTFEVQGTYEMALTKKGLPHKTKKAAWHPKFKKTKGVKRPDPGKPLAVAYGLGLDSTAILVGLVQEHRRDPEGGWRPDVITFADVGSEKLETYQYLDAMNGYLAANGFPTVTVVAYRTDFIPGQSWGRSDTLEQQVLINQSGPSITEHFGAKSKCSQLFKTSPQDLYMREGSGLWKSWKKGRKTLWSPVDGHIVKAIGYDATETRRMAPDGGGTGATFRVGRDDGYRYWYPLVEWGWDRARCLAEVEREMGIWSSTDRAWKAWAAKSKAWNGKVVGAPPKSSCTFCFAMKPEEIVMLSKEDAMRAVFMELVRKHGRQSFRYKYQIKNGLRPSDPDGEKGVRGLAGSWSWTDLFTLGARGLNKKDAERKAGFRYAGRMDRLDEMVRLEHGRPTVLTNREVAALERAAKKLVSLSADKGKSVQVSTLIKVELLKKIGYVPEVGTEEIRPVAAEWREAYRAVFPTRPHSRSARRSGLKMQEEVLAHLRAKARKHPLADYRFLQGRTDLSKSRWVQSLPAWANVLGFRPGGEMDYYRPLKRNPAPDRRSGFTAEAGVPTDLYGIAYPVD